MQTSLHSKLSLFDPNRDLAHARTIPSAWYFDPEIYAAECRHVFGDSWQAIGRADQVARPRSYFTAEIAGEPLLVVRDDEGQLRAFFNVCRHRAARVAPDLQGEASRFRCRYHGWTYDLTGQLRGAPEFEGVADFCKEDNGLTPVAVAQWGPLVWVHSGKQPSPLESLLAPLSERCGHVSLERLKWVERRDYEIACNWKVFVDNYLDGGYHINTIHPGLAGVIDYSQYRTEIAGDTSVQMSPLKSAAAGSEDVAQVRTGNMAYYWWLFPNLMINIYDGVMDTNLVLPLGPDRCRVVFDFYFEKTEGAEAQAFIAESIRVADLIQQEDLGICAEVQNGLRSRSFDTGRFSVRREGPGYHFHQLLAEALYQGELATCPAERDRNLTE